MILSELCAPTEMPAPVVAVASYGQPQDPRRNAQPAPSSPFSPSRSPSGGTPEPATMLLVAGSVLGYGALRRRNRKTAAVVQTQA